MELAGDLLRCTEHPNQVSTHGLLDTFITIATSVHFREKVDMLGYVFESS